MSAAAAPAPKKNTVDYIPSKLSYDTAIPVSIYANRAPIVESYKPYDIIDGPNPLDDLTDDSDGAEASLRQIRQYGTIKGRSVSSSATSYSRRNGVTIGERGGEPFSRTEGRQRSSGRRRSRSLSPPRTNLSGSLVKNELPSMYDAGPSDDGLPYAFSRPARQGWAAARLSGNCPYQVLRSMDMEANIRFVLDDDDYRWCSHEKVAPEVLQRGITYLEWAYVSFLLRAATPDTTAAVLSETSNEASHIPSSSPLLASAGAATFGSLTKTKVVTRDGTGGDASDSSTACAVCSRSVRLLSTLSPEAHGNSSHAGVNSASNGAFPTHDMLQMGLRCCDCGVLAHLQCWCLTEPPRFAAAWVCDGCYLSSQSRRRSTSLCCLCGRSGGVLLPYAALSKDEADLPASGSASRSITTTASLSSSSQPLSYDTVCHFICALSISELSICPRRTVLRRNGLVDMLSRPFIYPMRRVGKQKYGINCVYCHHSSGRCVQCAHPHCFEGMHASCAAAAHTADCYVDHFSSPSNFGPALQQGGVAASPLLTSNGSGAGASNPSPAPKSHHATSHQPPDAVRGQDGSGGVLPMPHWVGCHTYCRKHYGGSVSSSVGSAVLSDQAVKAALRLDLTGLITGSEGATSPVVRKRGRGRPPAALVRQREAEQEAIEKLRLYWINRREQRQQEAMQMMMEINARQRPIVDVALRTEVLKVSAEKVRLSHFLSLVPEWQLHLVYIVEGELPLPDDEADDVQKYRKVAHTRRSGNTRGLYGKMCEAAAQLDLVCQLSEKLKSLTQLQREDSELELEALRQMCLWRHTEKGSRKR